VDAPSTAHVPSLVKGFESGAFSRYGGKGPEKKDHALRVVFHLCGRSDVFEHVEMVQILACDDQMCRQ
jgi:ribonuclease Z